MRPGVVALALGLVAGATLVGQAAAGETRTVSYRGYEVTVPANWDVVDLAADPTACVRFDRPAVYLGRSTAQAACPAHVVGRSEGIVLEPLVTATPSTPGLLRRVVPDAGVLATAYYGPGAERSAADVLATGRVVSRARSATPALAPAAVTPSVVATGNLTGEAFDTCTAPAQATMDAWQSSYKAVGIYISGAVRGCDQPNLTPEWVSTNAGKGWQFLLIDVGLQAPCSNFSAEKKMSADPATALAQGKAAAASSVAAAQALGFAQRSAIYSDVEHYTSTAACKAAVLSYLSGWTQELNSRGYQGGAYVSASSGGADLSSAGTTYTRPDNLWFAHWGSTPVGTSRFIPATAWTNHQRVHQYAGDVTEQHGGISLQIDRNHVDLTAPPPPVTNFSVTGGSSAATLRWTKPAGTSVGQIMIRTAVGTTPPALLTSGASVYNGTASLYTVTRLANSASYAFRAWVKDTTGKVSPGADVLLTGTKATVTASGAWITYGGPVTISTTVTRLDGAKLAGAPIVLYAKAKNATSYQAIATVTSDANGVATSVQKPGVSTQYQWGYNGGAAVLGTRSAVALVEVRPGISSYLTPAAIRLGATSNFYGYVTPAHQGTKAYLQRKSGTSWVAAGTGVLSANGKYSFVIKPAARGSYTYRVVWLADADHQGTQTPSKVLTVS